MKFLVETSGTLESDEALSRETTRDLFGVLATALSDTSEFEADVAINLDTSEIEFFIVVDAVAPRDALEQAEQIRDEALKRAELHVLDLELSARPANRVAAGV